MAKLKIKSRNKYCFGSEFATPRDYGGFSVSHAARICCRDVRTINDWEAGKQPCPAWAVRLLTLESRYMDALYGLQADRGRTGFALGRKRATMAANDREYETRQVQLRLVEIN